MRRIALLLVACACGTPPGEFDGSVQSNALSVSDAAFVGGQEIWLSSSSNLCASLKMNELPKDGAIAKIIPNPPSVASLTVDTSQDTGKTNTVFLEFLKLDDSCADTLSFGPSIATSGSVTVTEFVDMQSIQGHFAVTFGNSDMVTGSFNAEFCDAPTSYPAPDCE
jgi:hypothetical protein